ncbi:MAG TPA: FlgD immunoglobulin-like domain containing protein [Polyangia bacterium]|jgi:flagellar basal-body rod modification protein FlgD|nr:FlgD immunoglobulin-like domain containing protein [Polyangia bacterium]
MPAAIPGLDTTPLKPPTTADRTGSSKLGKDDFLKLLMAQLANQDPTSGADNQAFVAQLAQFAGLEAAEGTNTRLDTLLTAQAANSANAAVGFIGKVVDYRTDAMNLQPGLSATTQASLSGAASSVTVAVADSGGNKVRTIKMGAQLPGTVGVTWDGNDDGGHRLPPGSYSVSVSATDAAGKAVDVSLQGNGTITGVLFDNGVPRLKVNGSLVQMSAITSINERNTP